MTASDLMLEDRHRELLLELLAAFASGAEVWAYGSRVTGGAHEGSDLDIVLRNPRALDEPVAGRYALIEALQESLLPMMVEVHDWARMPQEFRQEIERAHVVLQTPPLGYFS